MILLNCSTFRVRSVRSPYFTINVQTEYKFKNCFISVFEVFHVLTSKLVDHHITPFIMTAIYLNQLSAIYLRFLFCSVIIRYACAFCLVYKLCVDFLCKTNVNLWVLSKWSFVYRKCEKFCFIFFLSFCYYLIKGRKCMEMMTNFIIIVFAVNWAEKKNIKHMTWTVFIEHIGDSCNNNNNNHNKL